VLRARRNGSTSAGFGEPEALVVQFGQGHGGVEANDGKESGNVKDGLRNGFADFGLQVVELRGIVPREAGAVVAVIDVSGVATPAIDTAKHDRCIGLVKVMIFNLDLDS